MNPALRVLLLLALFMGCTSPPPPPAAPASARQGAGALVAPDTPTGADAARDAELAAEAASVVRAFSNGGVGFTPDGRRIVFRSDRDGLLQLYIADVAAPDAPATRLTHTAQRTLDNVMRPDGRGVLFLSDEGADDQHSIFGVGLDGQGLFELTPGEKLERDRPFVPPGRPDAAFYSARRLTDTSTTVFQQEIERGSAPRAIYTHPAPGGLTDVSPDGKRALFVQPVSLSAWELLLIDLEKGAARRLYPPDKQSAHIADAVFAPDGGVLVATDGGADRSLLLALDPATGAETHRYVETSPATAQISGVLVARRGGAVAIQIDAGSHHEVRLLRAPALVPIAPVKLPLGMGKIYDFSPDGRTLALTWSTAERPFDLVAVDVATGAARPLRQEPRPTLDRLPPLESRLVSVPSFDGLQIPVNLYLPGAPGTQRGRLPVMVMIHGGPADAWSFGWDFFVRFYSAQGYAVVQPNIRGSSGFGRSFEMADDGPRRLDALEDVEAVARWARGQPWADPERMVIFGGSYGGYMTLLSMTRHPDLWRAGISLVGPSNLVSFLESTTGILRDVLQNEFGSLDRDRAFLESISPLRDVDRIRAPLFVFQGANDPRVARSESDQVVRSMRARGVSVEYMVAHDEGHSLDRADNKIAFLARTTRFLENALGHARAPAGR
ncbi:alpha/beta fold hydrolase [Sorangium sp. So ce1128]